MTTHGITDAEYAAAIAAGQAEAETEFMARAVRYAVDRDAIEIVAMRNAGFLSAQANGRKGGRPRKAPATPALVG